jgi:hypothetical protein
LASIVPTPTGELRYTPKGRLAASEVIVASKPPPCALSASTTRKPKPEPMKSSLPMRCDANSATT